MCDEAEIKQLRDLIDDLDERINSEWGVPSDRNYYIRPWDPRTKRVCQAHIRHVGYCESTDDLDGVVDLLCPVHRAHTP